MANIWLYCLMAVILIFGIVFFVKWIALKRQLRRFVLDAEKLKADDYMKVIRTRNFDRDIIAVTKVLNTYIQKEKKVSVLYKNKEQQLYDVITGISHDFRTPLTAIVGYLQMIEKSHCLSGKEEQYFGIVRQKTDYLKSLSDDFFEMSLVESRKETVCEKVDVCSLLTECLLGHYEQIEAKQIQTEFDIPQKTIFIESDSHALNRIFENLISNTIKYTKSYMTVSLKNPNGKIAVRFSNDVYAAETIETERIFEPFYRGGSRKEDGSGIGLYVAKALCEQLGFSIHAFFDDRGYFTIEIF